MSGLATIAPSDAEWDAAVRAHLHRRVPELLPNAPEVAEIAVLSENVWLVRPSRGDPVVAKHQLYGLVTRDEPYDLLEVEQQVLSALHAAGHPVPAVLAIDPEGQFIFMEYVGPRTLAEALVSAPRPSPQQREGWVGQALRGLVGMESALAADPRWRQMVIPGAGAADLARAWERAGQAALEGLDLLPGRLGMSRSVLKSRRIHTVLEELIAALGRRRPDLGVTDYQPGNIVLDESSERLTFLELAKLGWDWTERRAVQYTTRADAGALPGLIEERAVRSYGDLWDAEDGEDGAARRRALDGHHVVYHLLLARRFCRDATGPAPETISELARLLATPLYGEGLAAEFRRRFRRITPHNLG